MTKAPPMSNSQRSEPTQVSDAAPCVAIAQTGEHGSETTCQSTGQSKDAREEATRLLAHSKWETAGCPAGDGLAFWLEAERELLAEPAGSRLARDSE